MRKIFFILLTAVWALAGWASITTGGDAGPSVVVHFDSGKAVLDEQDKVQLRRLFQTYDLTRMGRVFVLGFADSRGGRDHNYELSRKRAQAVRREIISSFGVDAAVVMALGKGAESPVADNGNQNGRAENRRVEIYLANAVKKHPQRVYGPQDPYLPAITTLIQEADTLVRERRLDQALKKLQQAHAIGGDHYSDWHAVKGIAGFYSGAPQAKAHLTRAIQLDPYNFNAREYLSRLQARRKMATGKVTAQMGKTPEDAIAVTAIVQIYEYLQLFDVEPLARHELETRPIQVWDCLDSKGRAMVYYFNHAPAYRWAFAQKTAAGPPQTATNVGTAQGPAGAAPPKQIWESKIFN